MNLNLSCLDCHSTAVGGRIEVERLVSAFQDVLALLHCPNTWELCQMQDKGVCDCADCTGYYAGMDAIREVTR